MKNEHNIDALFKAGLENVDIPFNEKNWENMVKKLEAEKKNRIVPMWWLVPIGIAAALIILFFTVLLEQQPAKKKSGTFNAQHSDGSPLKKQVQIPSSTAPVLSDRNENEGKLQQQHSSTARLLQMNLPIRHVLAKYQEDSARFIPMRIHIPHRAAEFPKYTNTKRRPIAFSIMAAPDISSTSADLSSKLSTNVGLLVTYPISNKMSISTGLIYAKKLYNSGGITALGYGYKNTSWELHADCRVLDIPINLKYKVFEKQKFSVTINTGLSSYLMLNERYELKNGTSTSPNIVQIRNRNQHPFSVANLSVGLDRKINSAMSIGLEPFIKMPLTGLGDYDARLKSTGIAVSINFSIPRPK